MFNFGKATKFANKQVEQPAIKKAPPKKKEEDARPEPSAPLERGLIARGKGSVSNVRVLSPDAYGPSHNAIRRQVDKLPSFLTRQYDDLETRYALTNGTASLELINRTLSDNDPKRRVTLAYGVELEFDANSDDFLASRVEGYMTFREFDLGVFIQQPLLREPVAAADGGEYSASRFVLQAHPYAPLATQLLNHTVNFKFDLTKGKGYLYVFTAMRNNRLGVTEIVPAVLMSVANPGRVDGVPDYATLENTFDIPMNVNLSGIGASLDSEASVTARALIPGSEAFIRAFGG